MHMSESRSGLERRSRMLSLSVRNASASAARASVSWAEPLAGVLGDLSVGEAAEAVAGELPVIQPGLVIADQPGGNERRGERVLDTELLDPGRHVGAAGRVEQLVEAIEDHDGAPGQQQEVRQPRRRGALVEGLQRVFDMTDHGPFGGSLAA